MQQGINNLARRPGRKAAWTQGENEIISEELAQVFIAGNPHVGKSVIFDAPAGKYVTASIYPGITVGVLPGIRMILMPEISPCMVQAVHVPVAVRGSVAGTFM